jgi:hypothetical protein
MNTLINRMLPLESIKRPQMRAQAHKLICEQIQEQAADLQKRAVETGRMTILPLVEALSTESKTLTPTHTKENDMNRTITHFYNDEDIDAMTAEGQVEVLKDIDEQLKNLKPHRETSPKIAERYKELKATRKEFVELIQRN